MRKRLALVALATTTLVVLTFLMPLGLLVRRQAEDRARVEAEREAQAVASLIALTVADDTAPEAIETALGPTQQGTIVVLPDNSVIGEPNQGQGSLVESARQDQATITAVIDGGWEIALPVIGQDVVVVVDVMTTNAELTDGVTESWLLLGLLGIVVVAAAVWVADRLGRSMVQPIRELEDAAHRLGGGDLTARAEVGEPRELAEVADAFNTLASRLDELLREERESVADLSHRLRTPLTALRLRAETLRADTEREETIALVDRLEHSIDQLIVAARSDRGAVGARSDLDGVVSQRSEFWRVLANEETRAFDIALGAPSVELGFESSELEAVVDALIGNVFSHTEAGIPIWISTGVTDGRPWLEVADGGNGFGDLALVERGISGGGSTGLGLDIVRRTAESTGGSLEVDDRPGGGAVVRIWFG